MADATIWARRVAEWRASGLTSHAFSAGREFTAGGLRHWAHLLGKTGTPRAPKIAKPKPSVRMARVLRVATPPSAARPAAADAGIVVEVGGARVTVGAGFERATLEAVLDVLAARGAR